MKYLLPILLVLLFLGCKKEKVRQPILLADREAPLGWLYLRIYADSTFEFESRELERKGTIYTGHAHITKDSIFFHYNDSVPYAGSKAAYNKKFVSYDASKNGRETLEIKVSKFVK